MSENESVTFNDAPVQQDYFSFAARDRYTFPDGLTYIEFDIMNEGKKSRYQKDSQRSITIQKGSGNAITQLDPSADRHALIKASVVDWNLTRGGQLIPLNARNLDEFLNLANPKIVEDLEKAIRKANPWLLGESSVEDIDREIESLQEMREIALERERGEASSASK